ncbi:hypothetical protein C0V75_09880 [Tabrizicola sp. TH137]|uniref:calcium-binding protein n=1 Tax=Tabrizicola sp. TH137 TaxID=2067452 RepID=UPI000C7E6175|nr:calcium-binding protein [Tabrizicola sp. TH137]PLL13655.1 hypothetical protein C0V75_09880 [Tabrizicola sp. TH137]
MTLPFTPTFPTLPNLIGNLGPRTVSFGERLSGPITIDSDITLPTTFTSAYSASGSLNGVTLTVSGAQSGDTIRAGGSLWTFSPMPASQNFFVILGGTVTVATYDPTTMTYTFNSSTTVNHVETLLESMRLTTSNFDSGRTITYAIDGTTDLSGSAQVTFAQPDATNLIQDMDDQTVLFGATGVRLDSAITLTPEFKQAYANGGLTDVVLTLSGWAGQMLKLGSADPTVEVIQDAGTLFDVYVDSVAVASGSYSTGELRLRATATAANVEKMLEAFTTDPGINAQTPSRTISVTIASPEFPQYGEVTFTGAAVVLSDLRQTLDVSYLDASGRGVYFDPDVTLAGEGPWNNGQLQVTGLIAGDILYVRPREGVVSFGFNQETGAVVVVRNQKMIDVANVTARTDTGLTFTFNANTTRADIETLIENLFFTTETSGTRNIQISVSDQSGAKTAGSIALNVGYIPTLTDMVDTLNLTAAEATTGALLDANVTFKGDASFDGGSINISGAVDGDSIILRRGGESPITLEVSEEGTSILIGGRVVGDLFDDEAGLQIALNHNTIAADIETILENLVFRTTGTGATRELTIQIADQNGDFDKQVVTVNLLPAGSKEMAYQILSFENDIWVPVDGASGITDDLDPSDLFGQGQMPDEFLVDYSGLLNIGAGGVGEKTILTFHNIDDLITLTVDGVTYEVQGPKGRLILDLAPGLHKITMSVYYAPFGGDLALPGVTIGAAVPPVDGVSWPDYAQTPIFDNVRTAPETLYRVEATTNIIDNNFSVLSTRTDVFYVTSLNDIEAQLDALRAQIDIPSNATAVQDYTTTREILGGTGADRLVGTPGNDLLDGGAGDDVLLGSLGADTLDGGAGANTAFYEGSNAGVTADLAKGVGQGGHAEGDVLKNIQSVIGSAHGDLIIGSSGDNVLAGGFGRDTLNGGGGDDVLDGGSGNDALNGGTGSDSLYGGWGNDLLEGGEGDDMLSGGHGDDSLSGGAGNDVLRGGPGADTLDGGEGVNGVTYSLASTGISVSLTTGTGTAGEAMGDVLTNISAITGSRHADTIEGSAGADTLDGGSGNDVIDGMAGNDQLIGSAGNDTLYGGDGDDTFISGLGADVFDGGAGNDHLTYSRSTSGVIVILEPAMVSGGHAEGDKISGIERITGSAFGDFLGGGSGNDTLLGGAGNDTIGGLGGNDSLIGGAGDDIIGGGAGNDVIRGGAGADTIDGGEGINTVSYQYSAERVMVHLGQGQGVFGDAQGDVLSNVQRLIGSSHGDYLTGSAKNDTISGGAGNDKIQGLNGNDVLTGGAGEDHFIFVEDFGTDRITDLAKGDKIGIVDDEALWGEADIGDVARLLELYGHEVGNHVELRLASSDVVRIDNITLEDLLLSNTIYVYD